MERAYKILLLFTILLLNVSNPFPTENGEEIVGDNDVRVQDDPAAYMEFSTEENMVTITTQVEEVDHESMLELKVERDLAPTRIVSFYDTYFGNKGKAEIPYLLLTKIFVVMFIVVNRHCLSFDANVPEVLAILGAMLLFLKYFM